MVIYKTVVIIGHRRQYWSDDKGLSWYWIGSRKPAGFTHVSFVGGLGALRGTQDHADSCGSICTSEGGD